MPVATVIIVKDEAENLKRLLESMSPEVIGNLFVTDTGSSDDTVAVAESYRAVISHFPWCKDFAAARNFAGGQVTENYDWIFMPDADEYFLPGDFPKLLELLEGQPEDVTLALIGKYHFSQERVFGRDRCYRRGSHRWRKRVHETPEPLVPGSTVTIDVDLYHAPGPGWSERKRARDLELLKLDFEENPRDLRNVFYLAREYYYNEPPPTAIGMLEYFLTLPGAWSAERAQAMLYIAELSDKIGQLEKAKDYRLRAAAEASWRKEGFYAQGMTFYKEADSGKRPWQDCIPWLEAAIAVDHPAEDYLSDQSLYTYLPHQSLSVAYAKVGWKDKALKHAMAAYQFAPEHPVLQTNLMWSLPGVSGSGRGDINTPDYWDWSYDNLSYWQDYPKIEESRFAAISHRLEGKVLDIGSGPGVLKQHYQGEVLSLDYSSSVKPDVRAAAQNLPFKDESFDSVVVAELLEHLPNPIAVLREAQRILRPGGLLLATVPQERERDTQEHVWIYSAEGLAYLLSLMGESPEVEVFEVGSTKEHTLIGSVRTHE